MLTPKHSGAVVSVRQGLVDHCHCIAGVAVVEPDRAYASVRLERSLVTGSTCASTPRSAVAVVGQPALRSAGRARSREVGRRAVRPVERVAAALGHRLPRGIRTGYARYRGVHPGCSTPSAVMPATEDAAPSEVIDQHFDCRLRRCSWPSRCAHWRPRAVHRRPSPTAIVAKPRGVRSTAVAGATSSSERTVSSMAPDLPKKRAAASILDLRAHGLRSATSAPSTTRWDCRRPGSHDEPSSGETVSERPSVRSIIERSRGRLWAPGRGRLWADSRRRPQPLRCLSSVDD